MVCVCMPVVVSWAGLGSFRQPGLFASSSLLEVEGSFASLLLLFPLQLVKDEPDLEPESVKHIFIENVMKLEPQTLTDNGFHCFDRFFCHVNCNDHNELP